MKIFLNIYLKKNKYEYFFIHFEHTKHIYKLLILEIIVMVTEIKTMDDFNKLKESSDVVIIDCWAPWCGPCKMYKPIFEKVAEEGIEGVTFATLDIDLEELEDVVDEFGISGVPYTAALKNGELVNEKAGVMMKGDLVSFVESAKED